MQLRYATDADLPLLAELNHQLIQDEGSSNPMTVAELSARMRAWLDAEYEAVLFELSSKVVAYALFRPAERGLYLRQFYVARTHRRQGLGRRAIQLFREQVVPVGQVLSLEVLTHNERAIAFWRTLGFREHALSFRIDP